MLFKYPDGEKAVYVYFFMCIQRPPAVEAVTIPCIKIVKSIFNTIPVTGIRIMNIPCSLVAPFQCPGTGDVRRYQWFFYPGINSRFLVAATGKSIIIIFVTRYPVNERSADIASYQFAANGFLGKAVFLIITTYQ